VAALRPSGAPAMGLVGAEVVPFATESMRCECGQVIQDGPRFRTEKSPTRLMCWVCARLYWTVQKEEWHRVYGEAA